MKKIIVTLFGLFQLGIMVKAQVGIGTTTPHPKAALEINSTDKGVLFPRMTTQQRDEIINPPNGLHVFNTDDRCLNYYDSVYMIWNSYCNNGNKFVTIRISADVSGGINFFNTYAKNYPGISKFSVLIDPGVKILSGGYASSPFIPYPVPIPALGFLGMPDGSEIKIINYGNILGIGGNGGGGAQGQAGESCSSGGKKGDSGGVAIVTRPAIHITIENYGLISGGGGGGGGGGRNIAGEYGGGGGGGAAFAAGGGGGGPTTSIFTACITTTIAQNGNSGQLLTGGQGGAGANGGSDGGNGGALAEPGQNGAGANAGTGGLPGITVFSTVPSGIVIHNVNVGQVLGVVQ